MQKKIRFTREDGDIDREYALPAKYEVCPRCEGHGTHLNPSIGEHAYTMEEFEESFDEEQRSEYFRHGGIYDVRCEECQGKNVVLVVDEDACHSAEDKAALALYEEMLEERYAYERECADERRMGC